jgi:LacI family transcriptional regulator
MSFNKKGKEQEQQYRTIKEIAKSANVSVGTIDRVIHNRPGVSAKTKKEIDAILREHGYQPNLIARRLASKKTIKIATLTPEMSVETAYWEDLLNGITQAEGEVGSYGVEIIRYYFNQNDKGSFTKQATQLLQNEVDGVVLTPIFIEESTAFTKSCESRHIPCVFINSDLPDVDSLSYIGPDLYRSGYLAGHLVKYLIQPQDKVLVVNISKELESHHYTLRKEEGFRAYFHDKKVKATILKEDIRKTDYASVEDTMSKLLSQHENIRVIFVTNSRVSTVAQYLENSGKADILLIGYDFLKTNIDFLKRGTIDFLICQKPQEQAYRGVMAMYNHLVLGTTVGRVIFMPIDIITSENDEFYSN